jgi:hypothetical protein
MGSIMASTAVAGHRMLDQHNQRLDTRLALSCLPVTNDPSLLCRALAPQHYLRSTPSTLLQGPHSTPCQQQTNPYRTTWRNHGWESLQTANQLPPHHCVVARTNIHTTHQASKRHQTIIPHSRDTNMRRTSSPHPSAENPSASDKQLLGRDLALTTPPTHLQPPKMWHCRGP